MSAPSRQNRSFRLSLCVRTLLLCALGALVAALWPGPAQAQRSHTIKPEDYFTIGLAFDARLSPDGRSIAYAEMRWESGREYRNTDIWRVDLATKRRTRLTFTAQSEYSPRWSPDGRYLYFLSARKDKSGKAPYNGKSQVWRMRPDGSQVVPVSREEDGVSSFQVGASGRYIYYTSHRKSHSDDPFASLRKRFGKLTYGHGVYRPSRLVRLDLDEWRTRELLSSKRVIREFDVSRDETKAVLLTTPDNRLITNEGWSRVEVLFFADGKTLAPDPTAWRKKAPSPYGWLGEPRWSSDGQLFAFRIDFDGYPGQIFVVPLKGRRFGTSIKLVRRKQETLGDGLEWVHGQHTLCYGAIERAVDGVYCARLDGAKQQPAYLVTAGAGSVDGFSLAPDGKRVLLLLSGLDHPTDLFLAPTQPNRRVYQRITKLNPQVDTWKLPTIKRVSWKSKDGSKVEGILELPPDYKPGKRLPLLVEIHGGPTSATRYRMRFWIYGRTLYSANGWAVLSPNYRGSTGYGDKFLTDLIGHKNDRDVEDILSGVDQLVAQKLVDPKKMAIMGWSNGGYLVNCLIARTTRFAAASSGAGVFDTVLQWLIEDTPGHVINFNRGFPWTRNATMRNSSPLYTIHKARTPTLIHVGALDQRVPAAHSRGLYRALKDYLKVPAELVIYPGEPHSLRKRSHRLAKMLWDLKWFDQYVLKKGGKQKKKPTSQNRTRGHFNHFFDISANDGTIGSQR